MMDREQFDRWLEREARRHREDAAISRICAIHTEHNAPPVSPDIEAFCASVARQWRKP